MAVTDAGWSVVGTCLLVFQGLLHHTAHGGVGAS
jgi:hypothetical protein